MEVRGTAVRSSPLFVKQRFRERLDEWLAALDAESRAIMAGKIDTDAWYPLASGMVRPTEAICRLFFSGDERGAWEVGRFSADYSLWGLYRLFVKLGSPLHLMRRATEAFATYYRPSRLVMVTMRENSAMARIEHFPEPNLLVEYRIAGWIERALEISGCREVETTLPKSLARGDECTDIVSVWS